MIKLFGKGWCLDTKRKRHSVMQLIFEFQRHIHEQKVSKKSAIELWICQLVGLENAMYFNRPFLIEVPSIGIRLKLDIHQSWAGRGKACLKAFGIAKTCNFLDLSLYIMNY